jgi:hypothetical protein
MAGTTTRAPDMTILEPVCYRDYFMTALWLRYQAERTGIEEKNVVHE